MIAAARAVGSDACPLRKKWPNENKVSRRERGLAWLRLDGLKSWKAA